MARRQGISSNRLVGAILLLALVASFGLLYLVMYAGYVFDEHTTIRADFRTITGLRDGSPVQLAGVEVGKVSSIDFVKVEYACDQLTEDIGRYGEGRTNNCDQTLFCSPVGLCADLEPFTALEEHTQCIESSGCREDEVCITSEFEQREKNVAWAGPEGVCVRYDTDHLRVRVEMDIPSELMPLVRLDSFAQISTDSVLGDQLVNISPGYGEPLDRGLRVQTRPSLYEDIDMWRQRLDRVAANVEMLMDAVTDVFAELNDPRWMGAIRGTAENLELITTKIVRGDGLVGALVSEPDYKRDVALMVKGIRNAFAGLSGMVHNFNRLLNTVDRNIEPILAETKGTSRALRGLLADLKDKDNNSLVAVVMDDRSKQIADDLEALIAETEGIAAALEGITGSIDRAEGTVGLLLDDPKVASDLGRLLDRVEGHERTAALMRFVLQVTGAVDIKASQDPAGPP